ncbi:hypothetical protein ACFWWM_08205 [Streptomyces sp. NPDC058682]|uniref:hypothetical protein n=1 Tax=Streptomyces sp. NPDC058682 TaxID=3346596 RepID=UPI0036558AA8
MWLNRSSDGRPRSLRKALKVVEQTFRPALLTGRDLDQAAEAFGRALVEALEHDPALAADLLERPGRRLPAEGYAAALGPARRAALHEVVGHGDRTVLTVIAEAAGRAGDLALERAAGGRLAVLAGEQDTADSLVSLLRRRQDAGLLDLDTATQALRAYTARAALAHDAALWGAFFDHLADPLVPDLYPVKLFLGRGGDAVRLADNPVRKREALDCCAASQHLDDVLAALELARTEGWSERARDFHERAGELLLAAGRPAEALAHCEQAGRRDLVSHCHEQLGDHRSALAACPAQEPDRLASLAAACHPDIDDQVQRGDRIAALGLVSDILGQLERAARPTERVAGAAAELQGLRAAVVAVERRRLDDLLRRAPAEDRPTVHLEWSRFEEAAGHPAEAAGHAEDAGDLYRAHTLFRKAERFGDADRVLKSEDSAEGRAARAASREAGGDLLGAARLHEQDGRYGRRALRPGGRRLGGGPLSDPLEGRGGDRGPAAGTVPAQDGRHRRARRALPGRHRAQGTRLGRPGAAEVAGRTGRRGRPRTAAGTGGPGPGRDRRRRPQGVRGAGRGVGAAGPRRDGRPLRRRLGPRPRDPLVRRRPVRRAP